MIEKREVGHVLTYAPRMMELPDYNGRGELAGVEERERRGRLDGRGLREETNKNNQDKLLSVLFEIGCWAV